MRTDRRARLLGLVAIVSVLVGTAWVVSGPGSSGSPADAATPAPSEPPASRPAAPPTTMPDGSAIPSPRPGVPATPGTGRTEPVDTVPTEPPVDLDGTGDFGTGLTVELAGVEPVQGVARAPGEIAGPAVAVTVQMTNGSTRPIPVNGVVVYLSYGAERTPATDFGAGSAPVRGSLAAGASVTGTYVFAVPENERGDVRIEISYTGRAPTVAFEGSVA